MTGLQPHRDSSDTRKAVDVTQKTSPEAETHIHHLVFLGLFVMTAFLGGSAYWAYKAKLDGAVYAEASLVVDGNRKSVQHLDGGIIHKLLVSDGDAVTEGQTLMTLDGGEVGVTVDVLSGQIGDLTVRRARLLAQLNDAASFKLADVGEAMSELPEKAWFGAFLTQQDLFIKERRARLSEEEILRKRMASLDEEIAGLQEQRESVLRQTQIAMDELDGLEILFERGLVTGSRVTTVKAEIEQLRGSDAALRTAQARARNEAGEVELSGTSQKRLRAEAIATELAGIEARLAELGPQLVGARERNARIEIKAPVSGRVVNLAVFTSGGVIRPGQDILEIVPEDEDLIVEARIRTTDIESVEIGQTARVQLTAFEQEEIPEAAGTIAQISADSLVDERTGDEYYTVKVAMNDVQPVQVAALDLVPGMPVGLFVRTGERTALSYLTAPLKDRLQRTFIE